MDTNPAECRPIECSQCKKKVYVSYSEVIGNSVTTWQMCHNCPILQTKLQGEGKGSITGKGKSLYCSYCRTSLESVLMGEPLGCKECYRVFRDVLVDQLVDANQLPPHFTLDLSNKAAKLHIGDTPHLSEKAIDETRMQNLTKDLSDAIKEENYEEAAWLRDQINLLTEKADGKL